MPDRAAARGVVPGRGPRIESREVDGSMWLDGVRGSRTRLVERLGIPLG
ncbi:hypothetical protein AKJ09_10366 [Labilithrix luteola]|uniref:Uncharacterized protein n=1 Tax=Labilithrix luteola TaxID=1391654 RepID=A0A0K1QDB5_9BACT|nr:hypothetical protein AKJ09_10366 [Labilithrix luteola]